MALRTLVDTTIDSLSMAVGDILYASSVTELSSLAIGTTGQVLNVSGGIPAWTSTPAITGYSIGTSGSPTSYTAGTPLVSIYATSSNTTTTNAEPFYLKSVLTGASGYGGRSRFHTYSNVSSGTNVMALKAYMEFGSTGQVSGLSSAFCAEMYMPGKNPTGSYAGLEVEMYFPENSQSPNGLTGFMYFGADGNATAKTSFDTNGRFFTINSGLTAGAGYILSPNSQTLKVEVAGSTRYLLLSRAEDSLSLTDCTTAITIGTATTGISVAANTVIPNLVNVGTSANPLHWDGVASNILVYQENTDTTPASVTANKFVLSAAQSAAVTSGRLECFRVTTTSYSTNNVSASMRSLVAQTEFAGNCTYVGSDPNGCYGAIVSVYSGANLTATGDVHPLAIYLGVETGSAFNGESSYIYIYNFGKVAPTSVMQLYVASAPSYPTYLIDLQGGVLGSYSGPFYTGDVNPTGATGDNALGADGHIKVLIGSTPYYIPIFATLV